MRTGCEKATKVVSAFLCALALVARAEDKAGGQLAVLDGRHRAAGKAYVEPVGALLGGRKSDVTRDRLPAIRMVYVPGGEFVMGSPEREAGHTKAESPAHRVKISPFWMGECEVTREVYDAWYARWNEVRAQAGRDPSRRGQSAEEEAGLKEPAPAYDDPGRGRSGDTPIAGVTPWAAQEFCRWLTLRTGRVYRLPTEAEWEYACRAGSTTAWHFGDDAKDLAEYAWYKGNAKELMPVGRRRPNRWGLYDMYGNVAEWTLDGWSEDYSELVRGDKPLVDAWVRRRGGMTNYFLGVCRGGDIHAAATDMRSAAREKRDARGEATEDAPQWWDTREGRTTGFRVVSPVKPSEDGKERSLSAWDAKGGR